MAGEITTETFMGVVQDLHKKIDDGFKGVYDKIDEYRDCLESCRKDHDADTAMLKDKQTKLTLDLAERKLLNGVAEKAKNRRDDLRSYFIKTIGTTVALAVLGWFYKLFIIHPM